MDGNAFVTLGVLVSAQNSAGKFLLSAGGAGVCSPAVACRAHYSAEPLVPVPAVLGAGLSLEAVPVISDSGKRCFSFCLQLESCRETWVPVCTGYRGCLHSSFLPIVLLNDKISSLTIPNESYPVSAFSPLRKQSRSFLLLAICSVLST